MKLPKRYLFLVLSFLVLFFSTSTVFAAPTNKPVSKPEVTGKIRACQVKQAGIETRMTRLAQLAETMQSVFDRIALRVEDYYTHTVLPTGKTVANYQALVDAIQTKRSASAQAVAKTQLQADSFTCAVPDPDASLTMFRTQMQIVKRSLAEYRTAVKNLIVAINSAKSK